MSITKVKGDMYPKDFVDYCWSPLTGGCLHQCSYCYSAKNQIRYGQWWRDKPKWASENFKKANISNYDDLVEIGYIWNGLPKLPIGKIFICHTTDLFAENVPDDWIEKILVHCWKSWSINNNISFIFQTKNPKRYMEFNSIFELFPNNVIQFGITLETNRDILEISKAPMPAERANIFANWLDDVKPNNFVTIEPIIDFDLTVFVDMLRMILPDLVWIGADSKNSKLPEPTKEKTLTLITELKKFTEVRLKSNLKRILESEE